MIVAIMTTALTGTAWANEVTISYGDTFSPALPTASSSVNSSATAHTVQGLAIKEVGIYKGSSNNYLMFAQNKGYLYNTTSLGTITKVEVTYSSGTSTTGKAGVYFGSTEQSTYTTTSNNTIKGQSKTDTWTNNTSNNGYFQLSTSNKNVQITQIKITYTPSGGSSLTTNDLTLNETSMEFDLADGDGQTFQLTNSGSADGALSYESSNTAVATVTNTGLITAVGEGTATITVTQAASETYAGGTATCTVTVTDSRYTISNLTFTKACGGSGTADDNVVWTVTSDGDESNFDSGRGIHYGTGSAEVQYIKLTTSGINGTIAKIVVNAAAASEATVDVTVGGAAFGGDAQSLTTSAADYTFTGSASGEIVVTVTKPSSATKALYVKSIKVYYIPSTDPYITAEDVTIAYDATSGSIGYSLTNATGNVTATVTDGDWLTLGTITSSEVPFTCTTNPNSTDRTATVTLSFSGAEDKVVTITQGAAPVIYTTISDLFAAATSAGSTATNVNVTFGNWVVSGVSGSNAFVTDNNGNGFIIYKSEHGFEVNDKLSGTVSETPLKLFNGSAEFTNLTASTSGLTVTKDGEITVITNKTIAELGGVNTGAVITLSNLTYDGTNLSDGTNTIKPYNSLYSEMSLTSGKSYNITGVYQQFNSTKEILPRSADDIVEVVDEREDAEIAFSVETLTFTEGDNYTAPTFNNPNEVSVTFTTTNSDVASWNNGLVLGGSTGTATITATFAGNNDYLPATATLVVTVHENLNFATVVVGSGIYQKVTSTSALEAGKRYLIVYETTDASDNEVAKVYNGVSSNLGQIVELARDGSTINNAAGTATHPVVLQNAGSGNWYIMDGEDFIAYTSLSTSSNNYLYAVESNVNGTAWTITAEDITNAWNTVRKLQYNTGSPRFACYTGSQKNVVLYKELPITITSVGYSTFASDNALDFSESSIKAFYATEDAGTLTFHAITKVPANTGVLLYKAGGATENVPTLSGAADDVKDNVFVRGTGAKVSYDANDQNYILFNGEDGIGFYKANSNTVAANRAYIHVTSGNGVKGFAINLEDDATGISLMEDGRSQMEDGVIYNLAGQRLDNSQLKRGIYIVNGKKILK